MIVNKILFKSLFISFKKMEERYIHGRGNIEEEKGIRQRKE